MIELTRRGGIAIVTMIVLVGRVPHELSYQLGRTYLATLTMPVPRGLWPDKPLRDLLRAGFRDRFVDSEAHPVLKRLRGEV